MGVLRVPVAVRSGEPGVDERYVSIHPHRYLTAVPLSIYQYNFVQRINALYFDNAVPLSQFIEVQLPQTQE